MNFGHFDDVNKEYVITTPDTPLPWDGILRPLNTSRFVSWYGR